MQKLKENRLISFIIIFIVYIISMASFILINEALNINFYINILLSDIIATTIVFIFSLIFNNSSVYDPYWSVLPIVVVIYYAAKHGLNNVSIFPFIAIILWGIRLTINWAYTFTNLNHEDWRYKMFKEKHNRLYPIINYLGIHMFPTLVVYLCMLPMIFIFNKVVEFNPFIIIGFVISIVAFLLQMISDIEMHKFRKKGTHTLINVGLWKYSRHPNYLGEILMWFGVYFMMLSVLNNYWYLFIGAIVNMLMFLFVSIPMAEKRQSAKEGFVLYKKNTHMLLPIPKKQKTELD